MFVLYNNPKLKERRQELRRIQTKEEKFLWKHLRNRQVNNLKFFRQYSIGPYIADFYCPEIRLVIELDGGQHAEKDAQLYDQERTDYLNANHIEVARYWNNEVISNIEGILNDIRTRTPS